MKLYRMGIGLMVCISGLLSMDARAQDVFDPPTDEMPTVMIGGIAGRDGAAFGPGLILEFHPNWRKFRRIGFYGFAGRSSVYGYMTGDGIKADYMGEGHLLAVDLIMP